MTKGAGLYIHVPFCDKRCSYCDFVTFSDKSSHVDRYLSALGNEMAHYAGTPVETIFVGGGTPTALSVEQIRVVMAHIRRHFDLSLLTEATVEANPESASVERLSAYKEGGINRLSLGLQTTSDETLERIGRLHHYAGFLNALKRARSIGFQNINIDLMFGLPGQTMEDWKDSLDRVIALEPQHVSAYALKVETGTPFDRAGVEADPDLQADMYLLAAEKLNAAGFEHYEISNFSRPGLASKHNLRYWLNEDVIGVGVSAAGYRNGVRRKNTSQLHAYIKGCLSGSLPQAEEVALESSVRQKEDLMLRLRLGAGVESDLLRRVGVPNLDQFLDHGLAQENDGRFFLTPSGWLVSNQLFQHLIP
jgi:oxygen-independent coproporphyrinogen III oxidase